MNGPLLATGQVRHRRLRPTAHAFNYPAAFLLLPMRQLRAQACPALARNGRAALSFHDADHGDGGPDALAWLEALLEREGVQHTGGEIWLQAFPRIWGYAFKPVSFWYVHAEGGALRAVVAEVHNTFGQRHAYLMTGDAADVADGAPADDSADSAARPGLAWGREMQADKSFHVSPFLDVRGQYRFRFLRCTRADGEHLLAHVDLHDEQGLLLTTSISGHCQPLTAAHARATLWRMPMFTLGVMARIHWQALRLWLKRVPWFSLPELPADGVTRASAAPRPARSMPSLPTSTSAQSTQAPLATRSTRATRATEALR
jgi:uncharacterized protein